MTTSRVRLFVAAIVLSTGVAATSVSSAALATGNDSHGGNTFSDTWHHS